MTTTTIGSHTFRITYYHVNGKVVEDPYFRFVVVPSHRRSTYSVDGRRVSKAVFEDRMLDAMRERDQTIND